MYCTYIQLLEYPIHAPRPSKLPSGNLSGLGVQNPRPWEISWASGGVFSNTFLLSAVYGYNTRRILALSSTHSRHGLLPLMVSETSSFQANLSWNQSYVCPKVISQLKMLAGLSYGECCTATPWKALLIIHGLGGRPLQVLCLIIAKGLSLLLIKSGWTTSVAWYPADSIAQYLGFFTTPGRLCYSPCPCAMYMLYYP